MNIEELIHDLRARINPQYYDQLGTESHERYQVVMALEYLREENERQRFDILAMNQSLDLLRGKTSGCVISSAPRNGTWITLTASVWPCQIKAANRRFARWRMITVDEAMNHARNELERAFEKWLTDECPSGDCESVQEQWDDSWIGIRNLLMNCSRSWC